MNGHQRISDAKTAAFGGTWAAFAPVLVAIATLAACSGADTEPVDFVALANTASGKLHGVDQVQAMTLKDGVTHIRGKGVTLGVVEGCLPGNHPDFGVPGSRGSSRLVSWASSV